MAVSSVTPSGPITAEGESRAATWRQPTRRLLIALMISLLIGAAGVTRIVFSREPVDSIVAEHYMEAISQDPAHAALYSRLFAVYYRLTSSDALHYTVHRVAERAAAATGNTEAAQTQAARASEHDPPQAAWVDALRSLWHEVQRVSHP
jgi:hypothetical protein